jgi:hypothetical protein
MGMIDLKEVAQKSKERMNIDNGGDGCRGPAVRPRINDDDDDDDYISYIYTQGVTQRRDAARRGIMFET